MRKAAGIILIIYGSVSLYTDVMALITHFRHIRDPVLTIFFMIFSAFIITGGVFCLKRKYWKLCFASALLAVLIMIGWIYWLTRSIVFPHSSLAWCLLLLIITGALPVIFVCIRKREWSESQV